MKALVYTGPQKVEVHDVAVPDIPNGCARIKVKYCGICGSDIGIFKGTHPRAKAPLIMGHEFIGTITEINGGTGKFSVGDRVASYPLLSCGNCIPCRTGREHVCRSLGLLGIDVDGGIAEYVNVDETSLYKIDDRVSDKAAVIIEPLAVIVRSVHQSGFRLGDKAVIIGGGPIGILTGIVLKHIGASRVIISEVDKNRLELCRHLGLETVDSSQKDLVSYIEQETDGNGVDIVFECTGIESALAQATKIVRISGMICLTAIHKVPHKMDFQEVSFKELKLIGTRVYTRREFGEAVDLCGELQDELEELVTPIVGWDEADKVFDYIADAKINTVKVVVNCEI